MTAPQLKVADCPVVIVVGEAVNHSIAGVKGQLIGVLIGVGPGMLIATLRVVPKIAPPRFLMRQSAIWLPGVAGAVIAIDRSTVAAGRGGRNRNGRSFRHCLAAHENQFLITAPGASAGISDAPGFGERLSRRKHCSVRNSHIGNKYRIVHARTGGAGVTVTTWTEGIGVAVTTRGVWVAVMTGATEMAMDAGALETSDVFTARTVIV